MSSYHWYKENGKELDYNKPIVSEKIDGSMELLLPLKENGRYEVVGYDWFNLSEGCWGSCMEWQAPEDAVKNRSNQIIYNAIITIKGITNE